MILRICLCTLSTSHNGWSQFARLDRLSFFFGNPLVVLVLARVSRARGLSSGWLGATISVCSLSPTALAWCQCRLCPFGAAGTGVGERLTSAGAGVERILNSGCASLFVIVYGCMFGYTFAH